MRSTRSMRPMSPTRKPVHDDHWMRWGSMVLRRRREALGLSREDVAQQTGLSNATIRNLERGKVRRPALTTLRVLCDVLSIPIPGEDGLYLSLDGIAADSLCRVVAAALYEFARRRRDAARFASLIQLPISRSETRSAAVAVAAERDLASDLRGLLSPDRERSALDNIAPTPIPNPPRRKRRTAVPSLAPRRGPRHIARPHG